MASDPPANPDGNSDAARTLGPWVFTAAFSLSVLRSDVVLAGRAVPGSASPRRAHVPGELLS